jgi:hypothetical protein
VLSGKNESGRVTACCIEAPASAIAHNAEIAGIIEIECMMEMKSVVSTATNRRSNRTRSGRTWQVYVLTMFGPPAVDDLQAQRSCFIDV